MPMLKGGMPNDEIRTPKCVSSLSCKYTMLPEARKCLPQIYSCLNTLMIPVKNNAVLVRN
jgi:hypothetical protein